MPDPADPSPPVAKRVPVVTVVHGDRRQDDYAWLRARDDPAVRAYLAAENAYADRVMAPTAARQDALYREMLARIKEDDASGALAPERIERVAAVAWSADPRVFFYVTEDDAKRPYRLWRHRLGTAADELVYEETDGLFRLHVERSRSRRWLFLTSASFTSTEVRCLPAADPGGAWRVILPREPDHEYEVDHGVGPAGDLFYIRTNGGGRRNFRLVTAPADDPRPARWTELLPHRDDVMLEGVDVFPVREELRDRKSTRLNSSH